MEQMEIPNLSKLSDGIVKVNQKIIQNYFENISGYNHDIRDIFLTYSHFFTKLIVDPDEAVKVNSFYLDTLIKQQEIWKSLFIDHYDEQNYTPVVTQKHDDKRFLAPAWNNPWFNFTRQSYLLSVKLSSHIISEVTLSDGVRKKLRFYSKQFSDLLSPSNYFFTNPEILELLSKTGGANLYRGFQNFLEDIEKGRIAQTDDTAFKVGKNLAITPGNVVYENKFIQLIQYNPATKDVHELPLLIVPPWINKYYILDLQPANSFIKYIVEQGLTVFVVSWRNPMPGMGDMTFDDYAEIGALKAIEVACNIAGVDKVNTIGYCLGGTLLATAAAIAKARNVNNINSITFLAAMVDFTDIGPMGDVIDSALVNKLSRGELLNGGILEGHDMEKAFNLIRANDLIWNYAINNYLKGSKPKPFDVLYWTNDNTNLPAKMYIFYMKQMILKNLLSRKNALRICNTLIDVGTIDVPVTVIGFVEDYISPPATVFETTLLVNGEVEFILGESGHVMGVVNPPSKKKYGHFVNGKLKHDFQEWQKTAEYKEGTWWITWIEKIKKASGKKIPAPTKAGNKKYSPVEPAPGKYVTEKCEMCTH